MEQVLRTSYLDELDAFRDDTGKIKIITGVRRCGKSTLMEQYMKRLMDAGRKNILHLNFEDLRLMDIRNDRDLSEYMLKNMDPEKRTYVFLDEVQRVDGWERTVNGMMVSFDADIYITGSNAYLLSSELSTYLTGRYVSIDMLPLSFKEYMEMHPGNGEDELFRLYMMYGAFPIIDPFMPERQIHTVLSDIYSSIVYRDVVTRGKIRDHAEFDRVADFMMMNIGNPISSNSIAKTIGEIRPETVGRYVGYMEEAFLLYRADRFDLKSTVLSPSPKYYSVDTGLRNAPFGYTVEDIGRVLENIVFLELLRRDHKVQIGKYGSSEIDFAARDDRGGWHYYQVTKALTEDNMERELRPLRSITDNHPKTVITMDRFPADVTRDGIRCVNIIDWLLGRV